jgi:hypothetical protein
VWQLAIPLSRPLAIFQPSTSIHLPTSFFSRLYPDLSDIYSLPSRDLSLPTILCSQFIHCSVRYSALSSELPPPPLPSLPLSFERLYNHPSFPPTSRVAYVPISSYFIFLAFFNCSFIFFSFRFDDEHLVKLQVQVHCGEEKKSTRERATNESCNE